MAFNNNSRKGRSATPPAQQRVSEAHKNEISIRLKFVDKLIKDGNLDEAELKLESVRAMDPRNGYVLALVERIEELRRAKDNPQPGEQPKTVDESTAENEDGQSAETGFRMELIEEVRKIEERLEAHHNERFVEETMKSEQRFADLLKEERERHDAETAALIADFEKEKEQLLKELKKETKKSFDVEFKKADEAYRKLLADEIRKTVEKTRVETSAKSDKVIAELKEALTNQKRGLSDAEREAIISETRKQVEDKIQVRIAEELARAKTALAQEKKRPEEVELRVQPTPKKESEPDLKPAGEVLEAKLGGLRTANEDRDRKSVEEVRDALEKHLAEIKLDDPKSQVESESKPPERLNEAEPGPVINTEERFTKERERMDQLWGKEFDDLRKGVDWKDRSKKKKE